MPATLDRPQMAKKAKVKRNDIAVKMDLQVVMTAKAVAALRGTSLAEYLSSIVGPIAARDLAEDSAKRTRPKR